MGKLQGLCVECSKDGSQFPDLKKKFLEVHQEVSQRFEKFDSEQASELTRVADDSVIAGLYAVGASTVLFGGCVSDSGGLVPVPFYLLAPPLPLS